MAFDAKKLMKSLTAGHGTILAPHIEQYQQRGKFPEFWDIQIRNQKPKDDYFHPSGDCFTPPRDLWLQMQGRIIPRPISPALRRTFDCGHMWHGYLQAMLVEMGFVTQENVEVYKHVSRYDKHGRPFQCAGTADLVDVEIPGHGTWLVDIKTMNATEFGQGASEYTLKKWQAQVNCYMDWFETDKAFVLAICKDSPHAFREYQIMADPGLVGDIYDRWGYVAQCLRANVEPDDNYSVDPLLLNPGDSVFDVELAKKATPSENA